MLDKIESSSRQLCHLLPGKETLSHKNAGFIVLSLGCRQPEQFSFKHTMPWVNKIFCDLLVYDYTLLHHRLYLQLIGYTPKNLIQKTLKRRYFDISLCKQLVILTYFEKIHKYPCNIVVGFSCCTLLLHRITNYFICCFNVLMSLMNRRSDIRSINATKKYLWVNISFYPSSLSTTCCVSSSLCT